MKKTFWKKNLGILGGGQLARMLALRGQEMGLRIHVLSEHATDPAAQVTPLWQKGSPSVERDLAAFFKKLDLVTFESEFMDAQLLAKVARKTGVRMAPQPALMGRLQDRLTQKRLFEKYALPTAPYIALNRAADLDRAVEKLGLPLVAKQRRFGYDGYGTFILKTERDRKSFLPHLKKNPNGFIAEAWIPFRRELAVMAARRSSGECTFLPWVESFQEHARCLWVRGPIKVRAGASMERKIQNFLKGLNYTGVMGIEFFESSKGLIVNEIAPRVHNSGHYSLDALLEDQFTLHWKSILNIPFSKVQVRAPAFAMYNLLGENQKTMSVENFPRDVSLHWYGKSESRAGRKMGHINALGKTPADALKKLSQARKGFRV